MKTMAVSLIILITVLGLLAGPKATTALAQAGSEEPPAELTRWPELGVFQKVIYRDLKRTWLAWFTKTKTVYVRRRERETASAPWSQQDQVLTASFYVTDCRGRCKTSSEELDAVYVAGVYEDGTSVVERWKFTYPMIAPMPIGGGGGGYVPLANRSLPSVNRTVLYQRTELGHIRSLEVDPKGRFLILLTYEVPRLFRLPLPSGTPQLLYDTAAIPVLDQAKAIFYRRHATEGPKYIVRYSPFWRYTPPPPGETEHTILLRDANDDGVFESPEVLTNAEWAERGYHVHDNWIWDRCE